MKIAITSLYLPSEGHFGRGQQVHCFANQMVARGHRVTVFTQSEAGSDAKYEVRVISPKGSFTTFRFARELRRVNFCEFDVLHAYSHDWWLWGKRRPRHVHTHQTAYLAEILYEPRPKEKLRMVASAVCEALSLIVSDETVAVSENMRSFLPGTGRPRKYFSVKGSN